MTIILGAIVYLIIAFACTVGILLHLSVRRKVQCPECLSKVDASQVKCKNCGSFLNKSYGGNGKAQKYMENRVDEKLLTSLRQIDKSDRSVK